MFFQILKIFVDIITPVFFLVFLGYVSGPRLKLDAQTLSRTAYFLLIPCFVFDMLSKMDIQMSVAGQIILYATLTHVLVAVLAFLTAKILKRSRQTTAAFVIIATFGNIGNLGLSLIDFGLGPDSRVPVTIYFVTIVLVAFVICVGAASWARESGLKAVLAVFKTPALIAMIPALFFCSTDVSPPLFVERITELLGRATIPMMLLILGVQLSGIDEFKFSTDVVIASLIRLIAAPLIAFGLAAFFSLSPVEIRTGILEAGMPVAVLGSIIAIEHDIVPAFVTTAVLFSTLLSLVTLTVLLYLV